MLIRSFPLLSILILFISSFIMPIAKSDKTVKTISIVSMMITFLLSSTVGLYVIKNKKFLYKIGHFDAPVGIDFYVGNIEVIMAILISFVALMVIWYSIYTIDNEIEKNKITFYFLLINILIGSLMGMVYTNDIFNGYVFIEIGTIASCGIVAIKDKKENIKAALKYLILSCLGSGMILMGIAFLYSMTGYLNMTFIHKIIVENYTNYYITLLITSGLFTIGLGIKSAMFPLHAWLPDAHASAPTSASAILSSLVLKGFVILLIKIIYRVIGLDILEEFPILNIILIFGGAGMIMASLFAIIQINIKKLIAYSSIAQMGYIFLGLGLGTKGGIVIAIFHIIGHAITKSALFLCVGNMIHITESKMIDTLKGIGKEMPLTLGLFTFGSISMIGIPIFPGFISKWYLALESLKLHNNILLIVILASSLLNAIYYLPIVIHGYFGERPIEKIINKNGDRTIKTEIPIIILIVAMICIGFISNQIINLINIEIL